jgi:hypothetical protein
LASLAGKEQELTGDWEAMLGHQLPVLPPFQSFWNALPDFFSWLDGGVPSTPASQPVAVGEEVLRPAVGYLRRQGVPGSSFLETIRFAASNRLCVDLDYATEQGQRSVRTIEPYSLRRTGAGDIVLHAVRSDNHEARSYRLDRIRGAVVTNRTFVPQYAIELSATELGAIPPTTRGGSAGGRSLRVRTRPPRSKTGPTHVYECPYCHKTFRHSKPDSRLGPHKTPAGWTCSGRSGYLVDTRY